MEQTSNSTRPASLGVSILTALAMAVAIFGAFLGSGALGGTSVNESAGGWLDTNSTLLSPAGTAFSIWSFIYLGLVVYAIWQFFPQARSSALQRELRAWIIASALLNAAWIGVVQLGSLPGSLVVILLLLVTLIRIMLLLLRTPANTTFERWLMWIVFGVYLGWVNVATIANTSALLGSLGVGEGESWITGAAVALLAVAALIALLTTWYNRGHLGVAAAMAWGIFWIGISRQSEPNVSELVSISAFIASGVIVLGALALRFLLPRRAAQGIDQ